MQHTRLPVAEQAAVRTCPPRGVQQHPHRVVPLNMPHGELGIVRVKSAHADHHGIDDRPQPVQVRPCGLAVDVVRGAGVGGDSSVQALAELAYDERPRA